MDGFSCSSCFGWLFLHLDPDPVRSTFSEQETLTEATQIKQMSSLFRRSSQWHQTAEVVGTNLHAFYSLSFGLASRQFYGDGRPNHVPWSAAGSYGMVARSDICIALREQALCSKFNFASQASGTGPEYAPVTFALRITEPRLYRTCCGSPAIRTELDST